jgi:WD40 repeat protein
VGNKAWWNVHAIAFSGTRVLYGDGENVTVLDTTTKRMIDTIEVGSVMFGVTVCEDGRTLLAACGDSTGRVVDLPRKSSVILRGHTNWVTCIIECGERDVLTGSLDSTICRWNRFTGERIHTYTGHTRAVNSIVFTSQTNVMFSASDDMTIIAWNVDTGEQIGVMKGHISFVLSLAIVNATTIVSGSGDKTVKIWDITTMKEIETMSSHTSTVHSVAVTPDRECVVSGSDDKTVKVWSIATGECITTLSHHSHWVLKVAVSPDGRFIASGGMDKIFHLLSVTPSFARTVCKGLLSTSPKHQANHRLLSDGHLLQSDDVVCAISRSTTCILNTEARFTLKNHPSSSSSNSNNSNNNVSSSCVSFFAPSVSSALQWVEAICAVKNNLALRPDQRSDTLPKMILRYRFDLLQTISVLNKRNTSDRYLVPKDVMEVIGNYYFRL